MISYNNASKHRGNDAFCVIGYVGGDERCCHEVHYETRRCVLTVLTGETYSTPLDPLADLAEGNGEAGECKGLETGRERKGREGNGI